MKLNKISLAAAAAFGVLSAPVFAIPADSSPQAQVRLSGASAQDGGLLEATLKICQVGTLNRYTATNQFVYYCNADGSKIALANGTKLAVYKHSVGGSGNGVAPINNGTALPFLNLTSIAASASCSAPVPATAPSGAAFNDSACSTTTGLTSNHIAAIGISDVEPSFFGPSTDYNLLTATPLATVIFGVPVTKVVYELLQGAQGKTVGALDEANLPSLSTGQVTSLYTQEGQTWTAVAGVTVPGDNQVYVARRVDSSGTQKTYEALIARTVNGTASGKSCQLNVDAFVSGPSAADNTAANTLCGGANLVVNGSGSGQVAVCLNKHQDALRGAVGTLTTESLISAGGKFRFVKINDKAPTVANVKAGTYTAYGDASLNLKTSALSTTDNAFVTSFKAQFAISPVPQPFGNSGLVELDVVTGTTGGNPYSRVVGGELNNCQQGRLIF